MLYGRNLKTINKHRFREPALVGALMIINNRRFRQPAPVCDLVIEQQLVKQSDKILSVYKHKKIKSFKFLVRT